jgi:hypothetical protein
VLPSIRTLVALDRDPLVPSQIFTFVNNVCGFDGSVAANRTGERLKLNAATKRAKNLMTMTLFP